MAGVHESPLVGATRKIISEEYHVLPEVTRRVISEEAQVLAEATRGVKEACEGIIQHCEGLEPVKGACDNLKRKLEELETLLQKQSDRISDLEESTSASEDFIAQVEERLEKRSKRLQGDPPVDSAFHLKRVSENEALIFRNIDLYDSDWSELEGDFSEICQVFHTSMAYESGVGVDSEEEFHNQLDSECLSFGMTERGRWSGPLHQRLAESLDKKGFSKKDWELSLPYKYGGVPTFSPNMFREAELPVFGVWTAQSKEFNTPDSPECESSLSEEQIDLERRIKAYRSNPGIPTCRMISDGNEHIVA